MRFRVGRIFGSRTNSRRRLLAAATAVALLPVAAAAQEPAQDPGAGSAGVTFYTGPNFTGSSKTLTLAPDQPYAALPFVGDELNEKIASLRADPQIGTILFQRPYFASRDDACGPNLGAADDPKAWWRGLTADFEPPFAGNQAYETAEMQDDDYSSVIAYRRELGPPPGFLLMQRRSYYNRSCERSADQSYFNRLFVPVPNPPQREACTDLATPANTTGAGADAPRFARLTDAVALYPEAFSSSYQGIDHRFVLTIFDGPGCSGASITLPSQEGGRPAEYRLSDYEFDRKAKSVMVRYQRGPLDRYLDQAAAPVQATLTPATPAPAAPQATAPAPQTAVPVPAPSPAPMDAPAAPPQPQATPVAPAPAAEAPAAAAPAAPAPVSGGLQPAPPSAPPQPQQEALQPAPEPTVIPTVPVVPTVPAQPSGPQEETFRFPVHQVYRLNFCLANDQGCGEPAANQWCEERGFTRASRWTREDNIGALYPTVFIGDGAICDKFLCDGFEEITCTR